MIKLTMKYGGDYFEIIVRDNEVLFYDTSSQLTTTIEGLKLNKAGVIKEFPDLKDNPQWNKIAVQRFHNHIKKFNTEIQKINYVKEELKKYGYEPQYQQRAGWRPQKVQ